MTERLCCSFCDNDRLGPTDYRIIDSKIECWRCQEYHYVKGEYKIRTSENTDENGNYLPAKRRK